jgi:hypothetical protein
MPVPCMVHRGPFHQPGSFRGLGAFISTQPKAPLIAGTRTALEVLHAAKNAAGGAASRRRAQVPHPDPRLSH